MFHLFINVLNVFFTLFSFSDTHSIEDVVSQHGGPEAICAIVTATSVFAPRVADDVPAGNGKNARAMPVRYPYDVHLTYINAIHFIIWVADSHLALVLGLESTNKVFEGLFCENLFEVGSNLLDCGHIEVRAGVTLLQFKENHIVMGK